LHAPVLLAVVEPICVVPSNSFTVLFAAAVPVKVSVLSLVMPSPATPLSLENDTIAGAPGGCGGVGAPAAVSVTSSRPKALGLLAAANCRVDVPLTPTTSKV